MPESESRVLYEGIGHSGLEAALERFRAFASAHIDMEPTLRCERRGDGRRQWVIDVRIREKSAAKEDDDL
jgi:hypothetical protein